MTGGSLAHPMTPLTTAKSKLLGWQCLPMFCSTSTMWLWLEPQRARSLLGSMEVTWAPCRRYSYLRL